MSGDAHRAPLLPEGGRAFLGSALFASAVATASFLTAFGTHLIRSLIGWPGLVAVVLGLVLCGAISLWYRRAHLEWHGTLPITVAVFVSWAVASIFWSNTTFTTATHLIYFLGFGALGLYVAILRDTIQVVRAVGDSLRILLGLSLFLEVFAGILIDQPIRFLGIEGNLTQLGPLQGVFGTRNELAFVSLLALITFAVEFATRSVPRSQARWSLLVAGILLLLSRSQVVIGVLAVVAVAALALLAIRRVKPANRWIAQLALIGGVIVVAGALWIARSAIIATVNAGSELDTRLALWREMARYTESNPLQGWGFVGQWPITPPYQWLNLATDHTNGNGLNAYIDSYFQLGLIGLAAFIALIGLALVRSWLLASDKRSIIYVWPALVLVALATVSLAESSALFESGWMLLIICAVKASRGMSWRDALRQLEPSGQFDR